jgi:hypothetical protein
VELRIQRRIWPVTDVMIGTGEAKKSTWSINTKYIVKNAGKGSRHISSEIGL